MEGVKRDDVQQKVGCGDMVSEASQGGKLCVWCCEVVRERGLALVRCGSKERRQEPLPFPLHLRGVARRWWRGWILSDMPVEGKCGDHTQVQQIYKSDLATEGGKRV